jgi:hypothetical protein
MVPSTEHTHAANNGDITKCHHARESGNASILLWFRLLSLAQPQPITAFDTPATAEKMLRNH